MAAPALSWCLSLVILLLPLAIPRVSTAVNDASKLSCFYNSKANISCVWSRDDGLQATSCSIHAKSDKRTWSKSCELLPVRPATWACNLILGPPDSQKLTSADTVNMSVLCLEGEKWRMALTQDFKPFENLRLMAPDSFHIIHLGTHRCNVTWSVSQSSHYIEKYLQFEARTRSPGHSWEEATLLTLKQNQQWICLETLAPDTSYELQVRVRPQLDNPKAWRLWSPWSQPLAFRTRPAAPGKENLPVIRWGHISVGLSGGFGFIILVYLLVNCRYIGQWLKKVLKCHIPDPSEFFSQLSSEHGGDFQKWLSSPFPSSSFSSSGPAPEISRLEVLDRDAKATQLLLLQQEQAPSPAAETSGHSLASCFTNQGYFFFHLPDALEIEACQVYFTYDPCAEELDEGGPLPALPPLPGEDDAYCTFPPGEDLLLFSPSLLGGPSPPNTALGRSRASEERPPPALQEGAPADWAPQPPAPLKAEDPDLVDFQSPPEQPLGEAGEEVPAPSPGEGASFPWASPPGQGQVRAPASRLTLNVDAYLSLQELQNQDPAHSV
ncbi:PREDICTED: interleukin-2 receptor subunit beta [Ceratotherium simum simum]|uniref:Interleukin-2 receptor subunit beta n=1 Tax=Ceratotherium simum simum TaxID=73337 RepID=A0ABM0H384_CERSS|nr:PREDICTED: interleukin-2 receptor subunit beta [Ceratotherium simum simum]